MLTIVSIKKHASVSERLSGVGWMFFFITPVGFHRGVYVVQFRINIMPLVKPSCSILCSVSHINLSCYIHKQQVVKHLLEVTTCIKGVGEFQIVRGDAV